MTPQDELILNLLKIAIDGKNTDERLFKITRLLSEYVKENLYADWVRLNINQQGE